jgi:hypothetical protein
MIAERSGGNEGNTQSNPCTSLVGEPQIGRLDGLGKCMKKMNTDLENIVFAIIYHYRSI